MPPYNYVLKSSNFSFNGNRNTWDSNYWHIDYAYYNTTSYFDHQTYNRPWIPTLDDTYIYFAGNSTGATSAQTGLTEGYTDSSGGNQYGYKNVSATNYYNHLVNFYNEASNYSNGNVWERGWKYIEIENLEPNTDYTLSVFAMPRDNNSTAYSSNEYADGFYLLFHDGGNLAGQWTSNYTTNWNNAQKSTRFYLNEYKYKRFSYTFTTDNDVSTTRVGIQYPHMNGYGIHFYGMQLEKKVVQCLLYIPTPTPLLQMFQTPHPYICQQTREIHS